MAVRTEDSVMLKNIIVSMICINNEKSKEPLGSLFTVIIRAQRLNRARRQFSAYIKSICGIHIIRELR